MNQKNDKLIIIGDGEFAQIAYEYFTYDSQYEVVAFSAEKNFIQHSELNGLPVIPFENLEKIFDINKYKVYTAITFTQLNRVRRKLYQEAKRKGFSFASYISSRAFVWKNVELGENVFIFENNVVQPFTKIGNNVVLWSGNHLGHRSVIKDNAYVTSHVVISGYSEIGESCFLGVNATIADNVKVAKDCLIGAGTVVTKSTEEGKIYQGNPAKAAKTGSLKFVGLKDMIAAAESTKDISPVIAIQ